MIEEKAIELAEEFTKMDFSNPMGWTGYYDTELNELSQAVQTVLNMLKEKDKEISNLKIEINEAWEEWNNLERTSYKEERRLKDKIKKKEKQIDLMAEQLEGVPINKNISNFEQPNLKECITIFTNKEDVKQYFENKAEKE